MVYRMLAFVIGAIAAFALTVELMFLRRDRFWRHHDHLIPPAPRSPRAAR